MRAVIGYAVFSITLIGSQGFIQGPSIPGGIFKVKVNLPDVVQAAMFAVNALGPGHALLGIVSAKKQVSVVIRQKFTHLCHVNSSIT